MAGDHHQLLSQKQVITKAYRYLVSSKRLDLWKRIDERNRDLDIKILVPVIS